MVKKKLLLVGDFIVSTGFSRVNHNLLERLDPEGWDLHILGINVSGDANPWQATIKQYPAAIGGDVFGFNRIGPLVRDIAPDVVVFHQDAWNVEQYIGALKDAIRIMDPRGEHGLRLPKMIAYIPVDAPNQPAGVRINDLDLLICPTQFGVDELVKGGYTGKTMVLPYGVDRSIYQPMDQREARKSLNFPDALLDAFIVGRADRNAPRKRYDLTVKYFADWWGDQGKPADAYLYLHCATKDAGWDLEQLVKYHGIDDRTIFTGRDLLPGAMGSEERLRRIMCSWDVHLSTTLGEGFGLVALESMACGVRQILPNYSGYGSWAKGCEGVMWVACGNIQVQPIINTIGGVASGPGVRSALTVAYNARGYDYPGSPSMIASNAALAWASNPRFDWNTIAKTFSEACHAVAQGA